MERLPPKREQKTMSFYVCHPCYCLKEALMTLLKCLGFESTQNKEEENSSTSLLKHHACASDSIVASEDEYKSSSSSQQKHSQEGVGDSSTPSTQTLVCIYLIFLLYIN